ncbi:hypothetical protein GCM10010922_14400 [Microbacterium sorbitolivorans]|uniref:Heparinase n=1 Tax=Microbacterium sorbitolivorans TaxID=1867410 RepID=A0A367Y1V0_9MICO|nr:hypothetical protein [Microbacterium sorbitolivorans]RCK59808.1 hypothetical protein DTO57_06480 [Microbacterium sorbitolivorans]GGF40194.1 hypothetical protein GCM10010922_14400 [Microbacterium sorbitolivorans]
MTFLSHAAAAADAAIAGLADAPPLDRAPLGPHRESMRRAKLLVAAFLADGGAHRGDRGALERALGYADDLAAMQAPSGLFAGGDNLESPPDTSFTVNDLCDVIELTRLGDDELLSRIRDRLVEIADRVRPALVAGGVHTPNHRWEICAALARLHRLRPSDDVLARIEQWLAEGIDIGPGGQYSERSANYAVHVSNPALLAMGDILGRPELHDIVERNLAATLLLIHPDASVETVHSRRQDQKDPRFALAPYLVAFRRLAIERGRADFAWAAELAEQGGIDEPQTVLAEALLAPALADPLPAPAAPARDGLRVWAREGLAIDTTDARRLVVFGGSDHGAMRRVRSGLANNPTFLRMFAGSTVLDSVRLSRDFFGLGPFRADALAVEGERIVLRESLEGSYYQPLPPASLRADADYRLVDEGRFAAAMAFDERDETRVGLSTAIAIEPTERGADLVITQRGAEVPWALELAFRPGGSFRGGEQLGPDTVRLCEGTASYGSLAVTVTGGSAAPAQYRPGEEYEFLGGTDAMIGPRLYITGRAPGEVRVSLTA